MEEETAYVKSGEEDLNNEAAEQLFEEGADTVGEIVEYEMAKVMSVSNNEMKEKREMVEQLKESEEHIELGEEGEEEEMPHKMEKSPHKKSSSITEPEQDFERKKKAESKARRVNMDVYHPDESKSSIEEMAKVMSVSNNEMKEKREMVEQLEESEEHIEFGEEGEEEEIPHKTEKAPHKKSRAKIEPEQDFERKKKAKSKARRVNMDIYYPDESKSSIEEFVEEKQESERISEGVFKDVEFAGHLVDPNKDYSKVDPSFLDEFWSTEEEQLTESEMGAVTREAEGSEEVEEEEFQEIYVHAPEVEPSDKLYDQICDSEATVSSDESFKVPQFRYIARRRSQPTQGFKEEDSKWQTKSVESIENPSTDFLSLKEHIAPALIKTLAEVAMYQPSNPVYYMAHSLLHKAKSPEELGLDPDPRLIQRIVDGHKKKKKQQQLPIPKKHDDILFATYAESHVSTPPKEAKEDTLISDDDEDDNRSQLHKFQRKYRNAKTKVVREEKAKRSDVDRKTMLPGPCLGPTSLPLSPDVPSRRKLGSSRKPTNSIN